MKRLTYSTLTVALAAGLGQLAMAQGTMVQAHIGH